MRGLSEQTKLRFVLSAFSLLPLHTSTTTISIRSADRTGQRQAHTSASLEAICLAAIDDWQFVKISRNSMSMCSDNAAACIWTIMEFTIYVNACLSRALIDKIEQTALRYFTKYEGDIGCFFFVREKKIYNLSNI